MTTDGANTSPQRPLISIVVPVFNEQDNVDRTYGELKRTTEALAGYRFEFIFTDNRSTDGTFVKLVALAQADPSVRVVRFARNFGFQKSVLTGYRLARGAAAIQIDGIFRILRRCSLRFWRSGARAMMWWSVYAAGARKAGCCTAPAAPITG